MTADVSSDAAVGRHSVLRTTLVRSFGFYALPIFLAVEIGNALSRHQEWSSEWRWAAYWSSNAITLLGPLVAGISAAEFAYYRRCGSAEYLGSRAQTVRTQLSRLAATTGWALAGHTFGVAWCAVQAARLHTGWHFPLFPVLPAYVAVVAAASLGAGLGWWWPSSLAGPALAVGWAVLWLVGATKAWATLVVVGTSTVSLLGLRTDAGFVWRQIFWWGALVGVGLIAVLRRQARVAVVSAAVLAVVAVAAVTLLRADDNRFSVSARTAPPTCSGTQPVVCVDPEYAHWLPRLAAVSTPLAHAMAALSDRSGPERIQQSTAALPAGRRAADGAYSVALPAGRAVDPMNVALNLLSAAIDCPQQEVLGSQTFDAQVRIAAYLVGTDFPGSAPPQPPGTGLDRAGAQALLASLTGSC